MLDWMYLHEEPLPSSIEDICRAIGMRSHSESIAYVLREFFDETNEGYIQPRVMREIDAFHGKSDKARASAKARWDKKSLKNNDLTENKDVMRTHSGGNANAMLNINQEPLTINHKPLTINQEPEEENKKTPRKRVTALRPDDVSESVWDDYLQIRKAKKSPLTQTALDGLNREADKAGVSLEQALTVCCERGWSGFKAEWYMNAVQNKVIGKPERTWDSLREEAEVFTADFLKRRKMLGYTDEE
jgi:uncharacterized protein YdaU (DUF1376 family)